MGRDDAATLLVGPSSSLITLSTKNESAAAQQGFPTMASHQASWVGTVDRIGIIASTACFVHCLLTPVVLSLSAVYAHFLPTEEHTHRVLAVTITLIGAVAIGFGYRRHKKASILWLTSTGLALIFTGAFYGDRLPSHWAEVAVTLTGGTCMIAAHRLNHTFCGRCNSCG